MKGGRGEYLEVSPFVRTDGALGCHCCGLLRLMDDVEVLFVVCVLGLQSCCSFASRFEMEFSISNGYFIRLARGYKEASLEA